MRHVHAANDMLLLPPAPAYPPLLQRVLDAARGRRDGAEL